MASSLCSLQQIGSQGQAVQHAGGDFPGVKSRFPDLRSKKACFSFGRLRSSHLANGRVLSAFRKYVTYSLDVH